MTVGPLTEQFAHQSGYVYADNDPVGKIDFMGMSGEGVEYIIFKFKNESGEYIDGVLIKSDMDATFYFDELVICDTKCYDPLIIERKNIYDNFDAISVDMNIDGSHPKYYVCELNWKTKTVYFFSSSC